MPDLGLSEAIDQAIGDAMARDPSIILMGEDLPLLRAPLSARFGAERVLGTPISESAFVGAAVGAAMAGLRPVVELYMVDFVAVAFDALLNQAAKLDGFTGGRWACPMLIRAPSGAGYGDGGQHGQSLWGMLASVPGLTVVVPSTPGDAYALTTTALAHDGPVVLCEPKLLSTQWLDLLGRLGRDTVTFDVPTAGARGRVQAGEPVPFGKAAVRRAGTDLTIASVAVGVHRALAAAERLAAEGVSCEVIDLRSLRPLDGPAIVASVKKTGRLLAVDEDYRELGLTGELAAVSLEAGLAPRFGRVACEQTIPFARSLEHAALPNAERIVDAARALMQPRV
jgi:pyruvate dehydrogenase E1 component beta subunit